MKPTQPLFKRIKARIAFTTKEVGKGFYRGSRVGSLGAHTPQGGYLIDYRKVRHFVVPDLKDFKLTPFTSRGINLSSEFPTDPQGQPYRKLDAGQYLKWWKNFNAEEFRMWTDAHATPEQQTQEDHFVVDEPTSERLPNIIQPTQKAPS